MKVMKRYNRLILPLLLIMGLSSCSYGFFNFAAETGSLELNIEFVNDNAKDVDKVKYELTPPKGLSSTVSSYISGSMNYKSLDNMDTGSWSIKGGMYADGELIQEFSYGMEILNNTRTKLRIEARWNVSEYEMVFQSWEEPEENTGISDVNAAVPAFDVSEIRLIPAYCIRNEDEEFYSVNVCILGSSLDSGLQSLELNYPDGYSYEYGYDYSYSRSLLTVFQDSESMIEILRNQLIPGSGPNGTYYLRLGDHNGTSAQFSETLSMDYSGITPTITGYNALTIIPATVLSTGPHDFGYEFNSNAGIATRLVFLINRGDGTIYPSDDTMAVGIDIGALNIAGGLPSGSYEFIVAAVGYMTTTPVTDAAGAGISSDGLRSENLAASIYELYGENTGYVVCKVVEFTVTP